MQPITAVTGFLRVMERTDVFTWMTAYIYIGEFYWQNTRISKASDYRCGYKQQKLVISTNL